MRYRDIPGWFAHENKLMLAHLIPAHNIKTVLEIGTCWGRSAIWFARRGLEVQCIDTWNVIPEAGVPPNIFDIFQENVNAFGMGNRITFVRGNSHDAGIVKQARPADLVYIDGDHTKLGCKMDIESYGPLARKIFCGDDYSIYPPEVAGVIEAVDELVPNHKNLGRFWWTEVK